jgi:hypothetical protein
MREKQPTFGKRKNNYTYLILFFAIFLIISISNLHAQGPNAPEAASFEPVDATDMVNLNTGGLSYVLPLLNIPSPEGGYPVSLSYHAGIAMEQEASWVGLGWSLNPGSINRGVNGYPDDWGETNVEEFLYDKGYVENFYSIGVGVTLKGGVSVGLGVSWGTGQSLGGYVSASIGLGDGQGSIGFRAGTNGVSLNASVGGFSVSAGTNGIGVGYSITKGSASGLGFDLNYSPNEGLSGGVSYSEGSGQKKSSLGIDFSSKGVSINGKIDGIGAGISTSNSSLSVHDYDINVSSNGFTLPLIVFYVSFNHTKVKRSLFKFTDLYVSGIGYPYFANQARFPDELSATLLDPDHFMDVNTISRFDNSMFYDELLDITDQLEENNLALPNYDNYTLTAQGISGTISPISYSELNLSDRGRYITSNEESYGGYLNFNNKRFEGSFDNTNQTLWLEGQDLYFYFQNTYSSFLRNERTKIKFVPNAIGTIPTSIDSRTAFVRHIGTQDTNTYDNFNSISPWYKKRTGNSIQVYTNKQIRDSYENDSPITGFIDATNYKFDGDFNSAGFLDRSDTETFDDFGIGAYKVTANDGKVYHYSLPVYNFETFYKNYHDENKENEQFVKISKTKPYATHWLLTSVTGPDYVDINNNGKLDEEDYGYWISFDYGKWSDGYTWETPVEELISNEKSDEINYSYAWGRKQLYYLDAIKSRTHTAIFVKELRNDNKSVAQSNKKATWDSGENFDYTVYAKEYVRDNREHITNNQLYKDDDSYYNMDNYTIPSGYCSSLKLEGKRTKYEYVDIPETRSLRLKKILLLKNDDVKNTSLKESGGSLIEKSKGYMGFVDGYTNFSIKKRSYLGSCRGKNVPPLSTIGLAANTILFDSKISNDNFEINEFESHFSENVIDVNDLVGLNLEGKSQQVIDLAMDYSLATNSNNSSGLNRGRTTLKSVNFRGKGNVNLIPPYKFAYNNTQVNYNKDNTNAWGYHKTTPQAWSLSSITTPTGGRIAVVYEKDEFRTAVNNYIIFKNESDRFEAEGPIINHSFYKDRNTFETLQNTKFTISNNEITKATQLGEQGVLSLNVGDQVYVKYKGFILNVIDDSYGGVLYSLYEYKYDGSANIIAKDGNSYELGLSQEIEYVSEIHDVNYNNILDYLPEGFEENKTVTNEYIFNASDTPNAFGQTYSSKLWYTLCIVKEIEGVRNTGGYRTKSISIRGNSGNDFTTEYDYNDPLTNETSGVTSYAPFKIQQNVVPYVSELPPPSVLYKNVTMKNYDGNNNLLGGTSYEFENLSNTQRQNGYLFNLGDVFKVEENQNETFQEGEIKANKYTIYNKLANLGRLKSVKSFNAENQILTITTNHYKNELDSNQEIGVSQESYKSLKNILNNDENSNVYLISSTSRIDYPSVLEKVTKNQGSFNVTEYYDRYDFLTGKILETRTYASDGIAFKTKIVPAYTISEYNPGTGYGMGSNSDDPTNYNMLVQEAASYTLMLNEVSSTIGEKEQVVGANITTWNNDWNYIDYKGEKEEDDDIKGPNIWRKHKNYVWEGEILENGSFAGFDDSNINTDGGFNWGVGIAQPSSSNWKEVSEITVYDHYSMVLESKDINDNYASTKMGDAKTRVIAVSNAPYSEMYYSGIEYEKLKDSLGNVTNFVDGEVEINGTRQPSGTTEGSLKAHTGNYYLQAPQGEEAFKVTIPARASRDTKRKKTFKVSVWVRKGHESNVEIKQESEQGSNTYSFNDDEKVIAGNWVLLSGYVELEYSGISNTIAIASNNGEVHLDDFRVHPVTSSMTSYVYNEYDEVTFIIGANGLSTCYLYDEAGRLKETWVEVETNTAASISGGFERISENRYNYRKQ